GTDEVAAPGPGTRLGRDLVDDLDDVERLDLVLEVLRLDAVRQHGHAERARHGDHLGVRLQRLVGAQEVHALVGILLDPHATAASAAAHAEAVVLVGDLLDLRAALREYLARLVVHLVEAAVVAGVVVRGALAEPARHGEPARRDQLLQQLRRVDHLVLPAELREFVLDRVEAVRAVDDDLLHLVAVELLDAALRHGLVEVLVAQAARRLAVAHLLFGEAREVDAG